MKVAVVILNWNGKQFLSDFLPKVIACSKNAGVIVADNASADDSVAFVRSTFPEVEVIINSQNGGYAKGYNDALKLVDAEYYVLLNSDIEVTPNWIEPVIALMDADSNIAACQPKIKAFHQPTYFEYAGAAGGYIDKFGFPFCRGRIFETLEEDTKQYDNNIEVFWTTGACMFVRAAVFNNLNGLDEDFFAHMEEVDLCWRMKNAGHKIMYCAQSEIYHIGGGTLHKSNPKKTFLNFRNNLWMLYKNLPANKLFFTLFFRMNLDGIAGIKYLLGGEFGNFMAVLKAHYHFYKALPQLHAKRKALLKTIKKHDTKGIYPHSIVFSYFVKGKKRFSDLNWQA
jgi:GT2 family glycosyltransferase